MIQVIIVEDEPAIARGLSTLITQNYPDFEILSVCRNGKEGLEKISQYHPDLVFVDIRMPVMNGLEMIRAMRASGLNTHCVILSGYAEFEYARTAISLHVSDYLLKPVTPDTLNEIMASCRQQHVSAVRLLQTEYLQRSLMSEQPLKEGSSSLAAFSCTLFFLFSGPMCSNIYNESIINTRPEPSNPDLLEDLEKRHHISLYVLHGRHHNESICAVTAPAGHEVDTDAIAASLYQAFLSPDACLNLVISDTILNGQGLHELTRNVYLYALFHNRFGKGEIHRYHPVRNEPSPVSVEIMQLCNCIPEPPSLESLREIIRSMLMHWQKSQITQFQLVIDLRYFISTVMHDYQEANIIYPDASELVCTSHSYEDLEQELLFEMEQIYGFSSREALPGAQHSLAWQVRNWLNKNFTSQITYKIFQDIFGYNEKYLSTLFKAEFGISPSKYIGELRLNMAKKLMQSNPDIQLKDVAEMVGFTDAFYFSRVFKSHEGVSPSAYLKSLKEG